MLANYAFSVQRAQKLVFILISFYKEDYRVTTFWNKINGLVDSETECTCQRETEKRVNLFVGMPKNSVLLAELVLRVAVVQRNWERNALIQLGMTILG